MLLLSLNCTNKSLTTAWKYRYKIHSCETPKFKKFSRGIQNWTTISGSTNKQKNGSAGCLLRGWLFHEYHGWIYRESENTNTNSIWLYDPTIGWLWTSSYIYPNLYQSESGGWIYYEDSSISPRRFYRYSAYAWEEINEE